MNGIVITAKGEIFLKIFDNVLSELQKIVGGMIELVRPTMTLPQQYIIYCNEEGKFQNLEFNKMASALYNPGWLLSEKTPFDWINGDVIIMKIDPISGEEQEMSEEEIDFVKGIIEKIRSLDRVFFNKFESKEGGENV